MRIISGKFKGKKLAYKQNYALRPTADMVKEALFAKLFEKVQDTFFLDLFCGTGQIGIEALSRGAKKVVFVDNNFESFKTTKQNLNALEGDFEIVKTNFSSYLQKTTQNFDLIFIDPPYKQEKFYNESLKIIFERKLLNPDGIIILESDKNFVLQQNFFNNFDKKNYGIKTLWFLN